MRNIAIAIAMTVFSVPTSAATTTGSDLMRMIQASQRILNGNTATDPDFADALRLQGFIEGAFDVGLLAQQHCATGSPTMGQLTAIARAFLEKHPKLWDKPAAWLVNGAFADAYPCAQPGKK